MKTPRKGQKDISPPASRERPSKRQGCPFQVCIFVSSFARSPRLNLTKVRAFKASLAIRFGEGETSRMTLYQAWVRILNVVQAQVAGHLFVGAGQAYYPVPKPPEGSPFFSFRSGRENCHGYVAPRVTTDAIHS